MAEALTALGLDANGIPLSPQWELDVMLLRTYIRRLRQACTHPQIGNAMGGVKAVNPRISSIDQVLASMIERNMRQLWELRRTLVGK
jgi:E3 ubiquitin-protein ligase SHPRH